MLFNSYSFLFAFLPATLLAFFLVARIKPRLATLILVVASVVFYSWWDRRYLPLLLGSAAFNYAMSRAIDRAVHSGGGSRAKALTAATILADLALLGYYKYADFFITTANAVAGSNFSLLGLILPLGISFFTFTQIAFIVDTYRGRAREHDWMRYLLFVTWFPHLIAGPIIHHKETMPQFAAASASRFSWPAMAAGSAMLTMGLFKKVVLADNIGSYVSAANAMSAFTKAGLGVPVGFFDGWAAALAYTLQLYFDFSGYSDMAIGLSLMFGVKFPANFNSPYQAVNIIDFWRRWHMTLSRFLRDYVYVPLGGNRRGPARRYINLMATMLIGGLWHGAGWTFVIWGGLHGAYLIVNHAWLALRAALGAGSSSTWVSRTLARSITFVAVVIAWVFFRAPSVAAAREILEGMAGLNGFVLLEADRVALGRVGGWLGELGVRFEPALQMSIIPIGMWILALLPIAWWMPNSQQIMHRFPVVLDPGDVAPARFTWRPSVSWAIAAAILFTIALLNLTKPSEFLYYQF